MQKLSNELRQGILSKIPEEPSDTKLSQEFGVSRKTIWRLRRSEPKNNEIIPPKPRKMASINIPQTPIPVFPPPPKQSPIRSKANVKLGTYFGIQLLRGENYKDVAYLVTEAAERTGVLFRKLQVLDLPSIGATSFVRFRSDIEDIQAVIGYMLMEGPWRAHIVQERDAYIAQLPGRSGKYSTSSMCATPRMGLGQTFAGTRIKRWKFQFKEEQAKLSPMKAAL